MNINSLLTTIIIVLGLCILSFDVINSCIFSLSIFNIICFILFMLSQIVFVLRIKNAWADEISDVNKQDHSDHAIVEKPKEYAEKDNRGNELENEKPAEKPFILLDNFLKFLIILIIFVIITTLGLQCRQEDMRRAKQSKNPLYKEYNRDKGL